MFRGMNVQFLNCMRKNFDGKFKIFLLNRFKKIKISDLWQSQYWSEVSNNFVWGKTRFSSHSKRILDGSANDPRPPSSSQLLLHLWSKKNSQKANIMRPRSVLLNV